MRTHIVHRSCAVAVIALVCCSSSFIPGSVTLAQSNGGGAPSPSPSPTPPPFQSPFPTPQPGPGEADAFNNLVGLYDAYQALHQAYSRAQKCGSEKDIEDAAGASQAALSTYVSALKQYIRDYSNNAYPPGGPPFPGKKGPTVRATFKSDGVVVDSAVKKASKYKPPSDTPCGTIPIVPGRPTPKPTPKGADDGILDDLLGHVSIGADGGHRHKKNSDRSHKSDVPSPSESTPPIPKD